MLVVITVVNISDIDLNLLLVLHSVLETESATLAARRLHVTQSAVSNALARLRDQFHDPLFIRHARGLSPTPRALALKPRLAELVREAQGMLQREHFDPRDTKREFVLACADYYGLVVLPPLLSLLRKRAPNARLRLVTLEALQAGGGLARDIDVHVGLPPRVPAEMHAEALFDDRFVCLVQGDSAPRRRITLAEYCAASHVRVRVLDVERDPIDDALAARGLGRQIALTVPHFSLLPAVVALGGYVATLSRRLAEVYARSAAFSLREPPIDLSTRAVQMIWHPRTHEDQGAAFFRQAIRDASRARKSRSGRAHQHSP